MACKYLLKRFEEEYSYSAVTYKMSSYSIYMYENILNWYGNKEYLTSLHIALKGVLSQEIFATKQNAWVINRLLYICCFIYMMLDATLIRMEMESSRSRGIFHEVNWPLVKM